jgi:hypothetical protein
MDAIRVMKASQTYATNPLIHFDGDAKPMPDGLEPKTRRPRIRCVRMGVAMRMVAKGGARPSGLEQEHPAEARAVTRMVLLELARPMTPARPGQRGGAPHVHADRNPVNWVVQPQRHSILKGLRLAVIKEVRGKSQEGMGGLDLDGGGECSLSPCR